jgi:NAD(P)-dependent dehydrogenase (short-subunit alcohol dehydrogenase family)
MTGMNFQGKTVLITGASRGIGKATALRFAQAGARVAVHFNRQREAAEQVLALLAGAGHMLVQADVADPQAVEQMTAATLARLGHIDILVNNAGIYQEHPLAETDYQDWQAAWQATINTNLIGAANLAYCVARHMIQRRTGRIINVTSRGAFRGEPTATAYGASKAGLNAFSQSLALHLGPYNISVTAVAPGWVETDMAEEALTGPEGEAIRQQSPLKRVARPEEVAYTILFFASEDAGFLTGDIVDVNGASYLRS